MVLQGLASLVSMGILGAAIATICYFVYQTTNSEPHKAHYSNNRRRNWDGYNKQGDVSCTICLREDFSPDDEIELRCKHKFHWKCIEPWMQSNGNCPNCRAPI